MITEALDVMGNLVGMSRSQFVSTTGAGFGFLGGLLVAFAAHGELSAHRLAINALQAETAALVAARSDPRSPLIRIIGTNKLLASGRKGKTWLTWAGVICLAVSLGLTVWAFFVDRH
jgi:hypothetical protein